MHFRIRGNSVQVVKTVVDKKTLSTKSVPAGSANIKTGVLSDQLASALTDKEVQEVRGWIEGRQRLEKTRMEVEAHLLDQRIFDAMKWLKNAPPAAAKEVVPQTLRAMRAFRQAAIKQGFAEGKPGGAKGKSA